MAANWMRRSLMVAACASAALLAACGSSTTESAISPQRMIAFGDGMSDVGQKGTRYTVNDGSVNNWTLQVASGYGKTLAASSAGGKSYAAGNARIVAKPDAAGSNTTLTVKEQIDSFLASNTFTGDDLVMINGGISDVIANMATVNAGTMTTEQMITASRQAGTDFAAQIRRLVNAGAKHVLLVGVYPLGLSPYGAASGQVTNLTNITLAFNNALKLSVVDLGYNVLYLDSANYYGNVYYTPTNYAPLNNSTTIACTTVLVTECTPATITPGYDYNTLLYASGFYFTPTAHRLLGNYGKTQISNRW